MKRLGITQRVDNILEYSERRDSLDQNWYTFSLQLDFFPFPLPNLITEKNFNYLTDLKLDAFILSGGNSITKLDPLTRDSAPERDNFEKLLLENALHNNTPIVGICRGMQMINTYLGGELEKTKDHVNVYHSLISNNKNYDFPKKVNSFHEWIIPKSGLADTLEPIAYDNNGNIEAFVCKEKKILGIMWHPERDIPFNELNIELIKKFFS